ncbi:MAG: hypothetical protein ACLQU2_31670 [Candidatus Binataceae bacterium]
MASQMIRKMAAKVVPVVIPVAALLCVLKGAGYPQTSNGAAGQTPQAQAPAPPAAGASPAAAPQPASSPTPAKHHKHRHKHHHKLPQIPAVPPPGMP